jgi:hypothetical protein
MGERLREGQGATHEAGTPLASRAVEAFGMVGSAGELGDGRMPGGGRHPRVGLLETRIERRLLTGCHGDLRPELCGTRPTAIPHVRCRDRARLGIHGPPEPLLIGLLPRTVAHLIGFSIIFSIILLRDGLGRDFWGVGSVSDRERP